jgi:hypothetical protein
VGRSYLVAFLVSVSLSGVSKAQLIDPNNRCYYPLGSTECVPYPPAQSQQYAPQRPVANQCEATCEARQKQCMQSCTRDHDFYRCFAYCGDGHTTCMHSCPMYNR